jgi:hypothetical protein
MFTKRIFFTPHTLKLFLLQLFTSYPKESSWEIIFGKSLSNFIDENFSFCVVVKEPHYSIKCLYLFKQTANAFEWGWGCYKWMENFARIEDQINRLRNTSNFYKHRWGENEMRKWVGNELKGVRGGDWG